MKHTISWKRGKHFGNTCTKHFNLMGLMQRKNISIESSYLTFLLLGIHCFNHLTFTFVLFFFCFFCFILFLIFVFLPLSSSWLSFGYTFLPHISFALIFNCLGHYTLLLPVTLFPLAVIFFLSFHFFYYLSLSFIYQSFLINLLYYNLKSIFSLLYKFYLLLLLIELCFQQTPQTL